MAPDSNHGNETRDPSQQGTVEALYEQVRAHLPATAADVSTDPASVAPRIRVLALRTPTLPPAAHTNVYLVSATEDGPVAVVDPGSPYPEQQRILDAALETIPVALVVLTHHHGDHTGGAAALASRWKVPIAAHARTAARLAGRVPVTQLVEDGEVIHGMTALATPGHADGHLCFEVDGAIIAGDMIAGLGTILIDPDEGDMAQYFASLEKLLARPQHAILPAHGPVIPDGHAKVREYLAHRRMREQRTIAALGEAPATTDTLVPKVYGDTPRALWGLAERSLLAHLRKLEREQVASVHDDRWSLR